MQCFNYAVDLLRFSTDAYIVAAARKALSETLEMDKMSEPPYSNKEQMQIYFDTVVESVLDLAFHPLVINSNGSSPPDHAYCFCNATEDVGLMIKCENLKCSFNQWFHLECANIAEDEIPDGKWFCSKVCKEMSNTVDHSDIDSKLEYTKALLWKGLSERVHHDAIREADGDRMLCHWRFDMLDFMRWHHPKYFVVGHRLLCYTSGGASPRIAHQLRWNRTVNVRGGLGNNIEMDLQMEFFNKKYKEAVQEACGNLLESTIARHSQMVGIKKDLKKTFDKLVCKRTKMRAKVKNVRKSDINKLASQLTAEKLFDEELGRFHPGLKGFGVTTQFNSLPKFEKRIKNLNNNCKLD